MPRAARGSRRAARASPASSIPSSRFGSALQTTTGARISSPDSSSTPSPGRIAATGTPAASDRAGLERRLGDRERDPPEPALDVAPDRAEALSRSPWWCISRIDAVPGSRGPAKVPIVPWQRERVLRAAGRRRSGRASRRSTPRRRRRSARRRRRAAASISLAARRRRAARCRRRAARAAGRGSGRRPRRTPPALDVATRRSPASRRWSAVRAPSMKPA